MLAAIHPFQAFVRPVETKDLLGPLAPGFLADEVHVLVVVPPSNRYLVK
jgi:hypothetical protein